VYPLLGACSEVQIALNKCSYAIIYLTDFYIGILDIYILSYHSSNEKVHVGVHPDVYNEVQRPKKGSYAIINEAAHI
jgi:hypothetical protein